MKKVLSAVLAVLMVLSFSTVSFASNGSSDLQFNKNGKFTMAVIADPQSGHPTEEAMTTYIDEMIADVQPDLVIFLGDNITRDATNIESFHELLDPIVNRGIPFTFVFGNHDDECSDYTKEEILEVYQQFDGCLAYDADPALHGCATHNLPILSSDGSKVAFNLWLLDSGDYPVDENGERLEAKGHTYYDCVRADQVEWYKEVSAQLEAENGGLVPSMAFQHIIAQEAFQKTFLPVDFAVGNTITYNFSDGSHSILLPNLGNIHGIMMECGCPSYDNEGEWDAMLERGDVIAVASGHDHVNDFIVDVDGIDAIQVPGCSYNSYGKAYLRGAKIITLDENDPWNYEASNAYIFDYALKGDSEIAGKDGVSKTEYTFAKLLNQFLKGLMNLLNQIFESWTKY